MRFVDKLLAAVDTVRETVVDETTLGDEITAVDPADIDGEYHLDCSDDKYD